MEKYAKRQKPVSIFRVSDVLAHHQVPHSERAEDINALQVRLSCLSAAIDDAMHRPARRTRSSSSTRREASLKLERETMGAPTRSPTAAKRKLSPSPSPPRLQPQQQQQQQAERSPSRLSVPTAAAPPPSQPSYYATSNSVGGLAVPLVHGVPSSRMGRSRSPQPSLPSTMSPITAHHQQHQNNRERTVSPMTVSPKKQQQRPSSSSSSRRVLSPPAEERTRLDELLEEERMVKARIETAKRLEEEKLDLLRRQQRLLDLDKERRRVEELRRQEERNEQERLENEQRQRLNRSESAASNSSVVMDPNSATQHASPSSTVLGYTGRNTSRSPSPLGYRRSSLPSSASVATVTDARRAAYDHLATKGMVVIVMPSATERTPCWMSIAGSTLLLSPIPNSTPIGGEIHHFPLADATILYHGGMLVQRTWPPRKVHVCGVVIGNRARSILIAKGCIPAASGEREIAELDNPYSLHIVVGAPSPYDTDSTLLVLHFTDRSQFATALLGLHCALWPNGRPALTRGRLLWMLASQLLLQRRRLWHTHVAAPVSSYLPPQESQQKSSFSAFAQQRHAPPPPPPSAFTAASSKPPSPMFDAVRTPSHRFSVAGIFANQPPPPPPPPPPAALLPPQRVAPTAPLQQQQQPWMESTPPTPRSVSPQPMSVGTFFPRSQPVKGGAAPLHFHRQPSATLRYDYGKQ